jgi:hypothetical protein
MPRVSDDYLDCVAYLYPSRPNAEGGMQQGGCGFFVAVPAGALEPLEAEPVEEVFKAYLGPQSDPWLKHPHLYIVTNWHVANENYFVRITTKAGQSTVIQVQNWKRHSKSDLAVSPIEWSKDWELAYQFKVIPHSVLLSQSIACQLDCGIGDDTFCVGRFIGHEGRQRNLPVVRFGHIAMMPHESIEVRGVGAQNVFLIESRIIQGYSGSPVFLSIPPWELRENHEQTLRHALYERRYPTFTDPRNGIPYFTKLLGITVAFTEDILDPKIGRTGMMAAIPAWELLELLNSDDLRERRKHELDRWRRKEELSGRAAIV